MPHRALVSGKRSHTRRGLLSSLALLLLLGLLLPASAFAQSGRIAGFVTDAVTGEPLPGVNVVIVGTTQGSGTDVDGYYSIINVRPGTYSVRASFIGYAAQTVTDVRVNIDLTTELNFELTEEVFEGEEVVVTATRRVIQEDVAGSTVNISAQEIESLPVTTVEGAVGLQAGIQGLTVRGSGSDQLAFMVNGLMLRDERNNAPVTGISMTSVQEVQVQTGGFNAEYGNVRSGVVNVVTKEGRRTGYNLDILTRLAPPQRKHFGAPPNDPNSYWIRPYLDPEVAMEGTSNWDWKMRRQYPAFDGWIAVAQDRIAEGEEPMTPAALQQAFTWQHRKNMEITEPDYELDIGFGGPVPFVSERLGDLRFYASMRREQDMYMFPLHTDRYQGYTGHVKVTSDLSAGMKLSVEGMLGNTQATSASGAGAPGIFRSASGIAGAVSRVSFIDSRIFSTDYWAPTEIDRNMIGATFTHAVDANTYYEIRALRLESSYDTNPGRLRDTTGVVRFGGVAFDEAPFGFYPAPSTGIGSGMRMGVGMSTARDSSRTVVWNLKADYTRQMNRYLQLKTGLEANVTENRINYGRYDDYLHSENVHSKWETFPVRGSVYGQTKLEFQGMVANLGLRFDYSHAGGDWYEFDPWTLAFTEQYAPEIDSLLESVPTDHIFALSPRIGVSFPITESSKLFFNYGHFRSMPTPDQLYMIRVESATGAINRVADPNSPLPRTVAYELGYEQALFDQFLVRIAGYYRDVSLQPYLVTYQSRLQAGLQSVYSLTQPYSYEDIRGFEFTVSRNVGRWLQGFVNYTYMVRTFGHFGHAQMYENPTQQAEWERINQPWRAAQSKPVPQPYARINLDLLVPDDFGPKLGDVPILGDWNISLLGSWQMGSMMTWPSGSLNRMRMRDYYNFDMRFARSFDVAGRRVQFFADITNLLNTRRLSFNGFVDGVDQTRYMESLHLPEHRDVNNIPGNDKPGDFRKPGVEWQPMFPISRRSEFTLEEDNMPLPGAIYYERDSGLWIEFTNGRWRMVDQSVVDQALKDKAYIEMPSQTWQSFLNPRQFYFGIRLSL